MTETPARLAWLDLARGLAVVSMILAHTWPWGGVWAIVEYLSAPWFALVIGISLAIGQQRDRAHPALQIADHVCRGGLLIAIGTWLQGQYDQIAVVLPTLGALMIVLAPLLLLTRRRPALTLAVAAGFAVTSPLIARAGRAWHADHPDAGVLAPVVSLLATGHAYRVTSFLAMALAGAALTPVLLRAGRGVRALLATLALFAASAVAYLVGTQLPGGAEPYSGTTAEIIGATLLSLSATWFCLWVVGVLGELRARAWLGALVDTGRMSLSAYTVQILSLAAIVALWLPGRRDDHWWVTVLVVGLCVGSSWGWLRVFRQGPLEALLRLPGRLLRRAAGAPLPRGGRPVG
jgi:uncharacterized membrane protein